MIVKKAQRFDVVSAYGGDPFVGHLSTPISDSSITNAYLSLLPAYKPGLSPVLRGLNVGIVHGYFLLGPFVKLGPLRESPVANFMGFIATISLIIILTASLLIYGYVSFSTKSKEKTDEKLEEKIEKKIEKKTNNSQELEDVNFENSKGWYEFTSGFIVGGFGGTGIAYILLRLINFNIISF